MFTNQNCFFQRRRTGHVKTNPNDFVADIRKFQKMLSTGQSQNVCTVYMDNILLFLHGNVLTVTVYIAAVGKLERILNITF